ncbi:cell division protein ZipA [Vibrio albus]|uniref:Cell division protein ZipA n=1 Tax=Vibrio albus TaxID=2200953 RepID=A0A2U3BCB0_9VIBR|nr:cell division protein ZipA [Vibrio albus]PWI34419.1 cell division protein ZipA [Vibrio albus]
MQELRLVLIVVGALAIAALLFHGLWTSKKEGRARFGDKPLGVDDDTEDLSPEHTYIPEDDFEIIKKESGAPAFSAERAFSGDPLDEHYASDVAEEQDLSDQIPHIRLEDDELQRGDDELVILTEEKERTEEIETVSEPRTVAETDEPEPDTGVSASDTRQEDELQVIVMNVHCSGDEPFVGTRLFDSLQQNGLIYGEMDIYHRHADLSGNGKVLFSVANMMQPGTLQHDDPDTFTTKGISFFMTLPCYGDADQNFKLMLKTAQQIADDMSGNVLDEQRNLMTPDKLESYRKQIREFKAKQNG